MQLDPDEIRDYRQESFFRENKSKALSPVSIFFSVLAAILVSWFIREAYLEWQVKQALEVFNQQMNIVNQQSQINLQRIQLQAEQQSRAQAERAYQERLAKHQVELDKQAAIAKQIEERTSKAQAWSDYYKPSKGCDASNENKDLLKCANEHIRAKNNFEAQWALNNK